MVISNIQHDYDIELKYVKNIPGVVDNRKRLENCIID